MALSSAHFTYSSKSSCARASWPVTASATPRLSRTCHSSSSTARLHRPLAGRQNGTGEAVDAAVPAHLVVDPGVRGARGHRHRLAEGYPRLLRLVRQGRRVRPAQGILGAGLLEGRPPGAGRDACADGSPARRGGGPGRRPRRPSSARSAGPRSRGIPARPSPPKSAPSRPGITDALHFGPVTGQARAEGPAGSHVPQPDRPVVAAGHQRPPVRTEGQAQDRPPVVGELAHYSQAGDHWRPTG